MTLKVKFQLQNGQQEMKKNSDKMLRLAVSARRCANAMLAAV